MLLQNIRESNIQVGEEHQSLSLSLSQQLTIFTGQLTIFPTKNFARVGCLCLCVEACHGAARCRKDGSAFKWERRPILPTVSHNFVNYFCTFCCYQSQLKTFACNCSVPGISMCSPCGLGLSPHGGGLAGVYVHGLGYDLVGLGA